MSRKLQEARWQRIWDLRNQGLSHRAIARQLGYTTSRIHELIHQSMHDSDRLLNGDPDTPQRFYYLERFRS